MTRFLIRRITFGIVIIVLGAFICYAVIRMLPNSFIAAMADQLSRQPGSKSRAEWMTQLEALYGLDRNTFSGFCIWAGNALRGDFGDSWKHTVPVVDKFKEVIGFSVVLNVFAFTAQVAIGIPLGILAARKQYSQTDYTVTVFSLMCISLPTFFLASLLRYVFSVQLSWFELYGITSRGHLQMDFWERILDYARHLVLPAVTLMTLSIGGIMRYTRTNMLEVLKADYIRTAYAKGLPEKRVVRSHAFRNTMIPLVTYFSGLLPAMFGGALITERIFEIPGIGWAAYQSIVEGDIPFAMFYMVFMIVLTQVSLIASDILYAVVDPRVRIN